MKQTGKILTVSVFFKANEPNGIRFTLTQDVGDLNELVALVEEGYDAMWRDARDHHTTEHLIAKIKRELAVVSLTDEIDLVTTLLTIGGVYLLETHGMLESDEYNGVMIAVEV
jgi:hypothetical protein